MTGQYQTNARPCYAERKTLVLDASLYAMSQDYFDEHSPYLWTASFPEYDAFVRSYVKVLAEQGFFDGEDSVGVVAADSPINRDDHREPRGAAAQGRRRRARGRAGSTPPTPAPSSQGLDQARGHLPQQGHRPGHVPRRLPDGLGLRDASPRSQDGFAPRYAISSFDNPSFFVNNPDTIPPATMDGMVGIGFHPPQDVPDSELPVPDRRGRDRVPRHLRATPGSPSSPASRPASRCPTATPPGCSSSAPTGSTAATSTPRPGRRPSTATARQFQTASGFGNALGDGGRAAAGAYRVLRYDEAKGHFVYEGPEVPFDDE